MQPTAPLAQDIKTLPDWIYEQFRATDPVEVKNILDTPFEFKYCVSETVETPTQYERKVVDRQYEVKTVMPQQTIVLMGAAAYLFVDTVARTYLYKYVTDKAKTPIADGGMGLDYLKAEEQGANATADVAQLVEAAKLVIVGKVGYAEHATATAPIVPHNPTSVADNNGIIPSQKDTGKELASVSQIKTPMTPEQGNTDEDAFASIGKPKEFRVVPAKESEDNAAHFYIDDVEVDNTTYNEQLNAATPTE